MEQGFSATAAGDLVQINGVTAVVISATATELDVLVPPGVTSGQITVTVGGVTVNSGASLVFTAAAAPVITSITPDGGIAGTLLPNVAVTGSDLTGASFTFPAGAVATAVSVGDTTATLRVTPLTGRQIVPLVATTAAGSSTGSVTSGNHFIVMISPDEASSQAISVLNIAPASGATDPTKVSNQAVSAVVSLLNTATPATGGIDPSSVSNQVMSPIISLLNQTSSLDGAPDPTNVSYETDSYLISLLNSSGATTMARNFSPAITSNSGHALSGGGLSTNTLGISGSADLSELIEGQQLSLSVNAPAKTAYVELSASGNLLERVNHAPYTFKINVPALDGKLELSVAARSADNATLANSTWVQKIRPDIGTLVRGRVVDRTGSPIAGAKVSVKAPGALAEYFSIDSASGVLPAREVLKATLKRLESGINWLNPNGALGADPIGTGLQNTSRTSKQN